MFSPLYYYYFLFLVKNLWSHVLIIFNHILEFTSEAIWSWTFHCWNFICHLFIYLSILYYCFISLFLLVYSAFLTFYLRQFQYFYLSWNLPFHLDHLIYWHMIAHNIPYNLFISERSVVISPFSVLTFI